jgi:hypothetical protein
MGFALDAVSINNQLSKYQSVFGWIDSLAKKWDLSYYLPVTVWAATNN